MLNPFQKKLVSWALACVAILVIFAFFVGFTLMMKAFVNKFGVVIWPLVAALVASFLLRPVVDFISSRARVSKSVACLATFSVVTLLFIAILIFAIPPFFYQLWRLLVSIPELSQNLINYLSTNFPDAKDFIVSKIVPLREYALAHLNFDSITSTVRGAFSTAWSATGGVISICSFIAAFAVAPIYLYYMLTSNFDFYGFLGRRLAFVDKNWRNDIVFCVRNFSEIMTSFFRGQMLIALIMGLMFGSGLAIVGVKFGFVLGFCAGVLNIIPYLGTIIGLSCIMPVAAFQDGGGTLLVALSLGIFVLVQLVEGYVLTPKIMGERTGLHPAVIIFSVFFWGIALNGMLGMILAIPMSAFVVVLWRRFMESSEIKKELPKPQSEI